ncbi:DUF6443 domain-containing protein [Chryseobacterium phocaeense]|uniref:DUF6443 domain-containing protein n=1 Tax=Chryseobacterium phocaeense TaxID=1816690 RepID=UPI0009BB72F8|nr:DUF6443 domain-containing protein [Chryseobacterium phocaeense]
MKKLIIPIGLLLIAHSAHAQLTQGENYIQSKTYLDYNGTTPTKTSETVQYLDGLGRPKQVVNVKASPKGRDVVNHIEYDGFGRQVLDFLPVPQAGTMNGGIVPSSLANANQPDIYGSEKIYAEKVFENSPLDRVLEQKQVGNAWNTKPVKFSYNAVTVADRVKKFTTVTTWENGATQSVLGENWLYTDGQLYKNSVKDEDGNETVEFKNGQGQLILARKVIAADEYADTYYVYNEYNQLAFVIPPLASIRGDIATNTLKHDELCYQYHYDGRNRLVEKKLPGKGWESMVYDKQDRLVATQDAELRKKGQWMYTKYDQFSRVIMTGISQAMGSSQVVGISRLEEQNYADTKGSNNEIRLPSVSVNYSGMDVYYSVSSGYPQYDKVYNFLSLTYYNTYPAGSPAVPSQILGTDVLQENAQNSTISTKGMLTASYVKNTDASDYGWTRNYTWYDIKGRAIGTHSVNHLGGYTKTESKLDFSGTPQTVVTKHKRLDTETERVITENFTYDHQNRLLVHKHKIDSNPEEILAQNTYNELSQLESKKVGGITLGSALQTVDYKYNIRGWMTQINDPANLGTDLFGYKIKYNQVEGLENPNIDYMDLKVKPKYNGNIAEIDWKTSTAPNDNLRRYGYVYDNLNRLTAGFYQQNNNPSAKEYFEKINYDLNGNISRLQRSAGLLTGSTIALLIDNLKYDYTGNRLTKVTEEQIGNNSGYPYFANHNNITYDDNGNMISHKDKGITDIQYNFLNLANKFSYSYGNYSYKYRADGVKIEKESYFIIPNETYRVHYIDTFQYSDYNDNKTFGLDFIPTSEGYFSFRNNQYIYNYTDHLGNVRLSYNLNKETSHLNITEENNYYPFGLKHEGYNNLTGGLVPYQYKYNGKELQETGMYDYGARMYMPDLGRWSVVDPLAEKMTRHSPYNYAFNNPIRFIDPDGRMAIENDDEFRVDPSGKITQVEKAGEDVIVMVDKKGNETGVRVNIGENAELAQGNGRTQALVVNDQEKGHEAFKAIADHSKVEYAKIEYTDASANEKTMLFTNGERNEVQASDVGKALENAGNVVTTIDHSHKFGLPTPSSYNRSSQLVETSKVGDAAGATNYPVNSQGQPINRHVYVPNSGGTAYKYDNVKYEKVENY